MDVGHGKIRIILSYKESSRNTVGNFESIFQVCLSFQCWESFGQSMLLRLARKLACTGGQAGAFKMLVGNYVGVITRYWFGSVFFF